MASIISASTTSATALNLSGDTTGILQLATGATPTTAVTIDASQNVGIGTSSPSTYGKLAIALSNAASTTTNGIAMQALSAQDASSLRISGYGYAGRQQTAIDFLQNSGTNWNSQIVFSTDSGGGMSERMRIDNSGYVGVGTTSAQNQLSINTGGTTNPTVASLGGSSLSLTSLPTAFGVTGRIFFGNSQASTGMFASIAGNYDTYSTGAGGSLLFNTSPGTGTAGITERMRIDSNGYALIGYTSSNGAYKLQVNSQIFATSSTIATSDARYKTDVTPISGALDIVNSLNPVEFNWKEHPVHAFDTTNKTVGFLAQEVQEIIKDKPYVNSIIKKNNCVIEPEEKDEDGNVIKEAVTEEFLGIAEGNMIAILTKAIQEQQTIINDLKARVTALESKIV